MLNFNSNGYLEPFEAIEIDFEGAESLLVWNEHRAHIWANFEVFIVDLRVILASSFSVWLNGSFATQKESPNDLDCVIFVDFEVYEANEIVLAQFKNLAFKKKQKLDVYFVKTYPNNHKFAFVYELNRQEWLFAFSRTNPNKTKSTYLKGFLELKFDYNGNEHLEL